MKLNLKMIAAAAALVAAGTTSAQTTAVNTGNGSFIVYAYNTVTNGYYLRDLGLLINDFLPNSIGPVSGDNPLAGNKTPEAGFSQSFATDQVFTDWRAGATTILWGAVAGDSLNAGANGVSRMIFASGVNPNVTNGVLNNAVAGANFGSVINQLAAASSVSFASGVGTSITNAGGVGAVNNSLLGSAANLYYYTRTVQGTAAAATQANETLYQNSLNVATLTMALDGTVTYLLAPAAVAEVPLPAAAWLLGAGLLGLGGVIRRRKADAQA